MTIRQHVPGFVDLGDEEPRHAEYSTKEELLQIPWVASYMTRYEHPAVKPFHRWSLSDHWLMAEFDEGREFWVVGFLSDPIAIDLPQWVAPKDDPK